MAAYLRELRWPEFSAYRAHVEKFYSALNFTLAWTRNRQPTLQAQTMIGALRSADTKGLDPEDYDGSRLAASIVYAPPTGYL